LKGTRTSTSNTEIIIQHDSPNKGPKYYLHIDGDGNIEYHGISNVKMVGKHISKISPKELENLVFEFKNVYFFSFNDNYGPASDQYDLAQEQQLQQTSVALKLGDKYKSVKFLDEGSNMPSQLKNLVKTIEKITRVDQLSGINLYTSKR
jgi:Domain of unknown function (DUF6438)